MDYQFDLVSIGSGPAGQRAAVQAAKLGKRAALIERRRVLGGVCVDTGTVPSKTFREAVLWASGTAGTDGRSALQPERRPTAEQLLQRVNAVVERECRVIEDQLRRNDVEVIRGEASFKDPHTLIVRTDNGWREVTAASIVLAVGTQPGPVPGVAPDGEVIISSDDILSLKRIPRTLTVVGAGVIGIEYASMFGALGVQVSLMERRDRPLEFLDHEIVDELLHQMRKRNVMYRPGEAVARLEIAEGPPKRVVLELESGKRMVSDLALFAIGRIGVTDALNLGAAGLAADDRGRLKVDEQFRTAVAHIFAAGDVVGYPSLAATSSEQGRIAACHALGVPAKPMATHFPVGIYAIPEISMAGAP